MMLMTMIDDVAHDDDEDDDDNGDCRCDQEYADAHHRRKNIVSALSHCCVLVRILSR